MDAKFMRITEQAPVAVLTIDRPPVNAISTDLLHELREAVGYLARAADLRVVVLTGAGRAFVGGADIAEMRDMTAGQGREFAAFGQAVFFELEQLPKPVVAAVNGYALGGGCELAMACDIRLASETAKFGQPEINRGVLPGFGGTQRLPRLVGGGKAKELLFTGALVDAPEALRIGLVDRVVPAERLLSEAMALASLIGTKSQAVLRLAKKAAQAAQDLDLRSGCALEAELLGHCFATEDQKEGMAAFLEKRKPEFRHR